MHNLDPAVSLNRQSLLRPWFLFPAQTELSEDEAEDLIATVRSYLWPTRHTTAGEVRKRLETLKPGASLPFLYLMRYIAFRAAGSHFYWPPFRKTLFDDVLSYNDVAIGLAATTARLWNQLYLYTQHALYFPPEGPTNIKWPLAHAGLLPAYKTVLREFGLDLLAADEAGDLYAETVALGSDEFLLRLADWLAEHPRYQSNPLHALVHSARRERLIIAELAQQWLDYARPELEDALDALDQPRQRLLLPRRFLAYRRATNQLGIIFRLGRVAARVQAQLSWGDRTLTLGFRDLPQTNVREFLDEFLPLAGQLWPADARLTLPGRPPLACPLPTLARQPGAVFDPVTGAQTRRWRLDQEYYILVDAHALAKVKLHALFAESFDQGTPRGAWPDYRLLWVRTRSLDDLADTDLAALEEMEEAAERLALPSFQHQLRPRLRLIGGDLLADPPGGTPTYANAKPPHLEITGRWTTDFDLQLLYRAPADPAPRLLTQLRMTPPAAGVSRILALWQDCRQPGEYTVRAGDDQIVFQFQPPRADAAASVPAWQLDVQPCEGEAKVAVLNRYALDDAALTVQTWPSAELHLQVQDYAGKTSARHTIQADAAGIWQANLTDLAINWASFAPGDLTLEISWRGLFAQRITLADAAFVVAEGLQMTVHRSPSAQRFAVACTGNIRGHPTGEPLVGYLLPRLPWQHPPRQVELKVGEAGHFEGNIIVDWEPRWLVIGDQWLLTPTDSRPIHVAALPNRNPATQQPGALTLVEASEPVVNAWAALAPRIAAQAHPPELTPYLQVSPAFHVLPRFRRFLTVTREWQAIRYWEEWEELIARGGADLQVAIFRHNLPNGQRAQDVLPVTASFNPKTYEEGRLSFSFGRDRIGGSFVCVPFAGHNRIGLMPNRTLYACAKCNVVVPHDAFDHHRAPFADLPSCTASKPAFVAYVPGDPDRSNCVAVAVLRDPATSVDQFADYLNEMLAARRQPDDRYRDLLAQLQPLVPPSVAPADWLAKLAAALKQLIQLRKAYSQWQRLTLTKLAELAAPLIDYADAMDCVVKVLTAPPEPKAPPLAKPAPVVQVIAPTPPTPAPTTPTPSPVSPITVAPTPPAPPAVATPVTRPVAKPATPKQPAPPAQIRLNTKERVYLILSARDQYILDDAQRYVTELLTPKFAVTGPYRLREIRDSHGTLYRLYLSIPELARFTPVVKNLKLARGVISAIRKDLPD